MFRIRRFAQTGSTNDDAARLLGEPDSAGLVLTTDFQTGGHGRRGRTWHAPPGSSLLFTAILPRQLRSRDLWAVTFWTALAVADGLEATTGVRVELQWPNDLLIDGRKCCGILCISRVAGELAWAGCGVGINVVRPAHNADLSAVVPPPAFLSDVAPESAGSPDDRERILTAILAAFEKRDGSLDDAPGIAREWETRATLFGTRYRILIDGESTPFDARAQSLAPDGSLVVKTTDETSRTINLGDARILRPGQWLD
jgi:BirA family biotin operon repressor/biotin-[acetyl-CoA-carboxylase] ligase